MSKTSLSQIKQTMSDPWALNMLSKCLLKTNVYHRYRALRIECACKSCSVKKGPSLWMPHNWGSRLKSGGMGVNGQRHTGVHACGQTSHTAVALFLNTQAADPARSIFPDSVFCGSILINAFGRLVQWKGSFIFMRRAPVMWLQRVTMNGYKLQIPVHSAESVSAEDLHLPVVYLHCCLVVPCTMQTKLQ